MLRSLLLIAFVGLMTENGFAQEQYRLPPQEVTDIIDAKPEPTVSVSPDRQWMLLIERDSMPSIADVSRRMLKLAGMRIDPAANSRFQSRYFAGLSLRPMDSENAVNIPIPDASKISDVSWCHDSKTLAFVAVTQSGSQLWITSVDNPGKPTMLTDRLNSIMGDFEWFPHGKKILAYVVPEDRGQEPAQPTIPSGPRVQESSGNTSPTRTYQDLLQNPYDEKLFEYYATSCLRVFDFSTIDSGVNTSTPGRPAIYGSVQISPDGENLLVTTIRRPFSYLMTVGSFPRTIEVWGIDGRVKYEVANVPMAENIPIEGVRTGPRNVTWMSGRKATLVWNEALDGGDPNRKAEHRDAYVAIAAPFDAEPETFIKAQHRAYGLSYFENPSQVSTLEYDRDRRWIRSLIYDLDEPETTPKIATDRSIRDRYGDPGRIVTRRDETGHSVAMQHGDFVYRIGSGATPNGDLPFVDRQNLSTMETERLWRCKEGELESVVAVVDDESNNKPKIITVSESKTTPPNYFLRDLNDDSKVALTDFQDPTPQIRGITKQLVTYERSDGVKLSAKLYLPADYQEGTRLPLIVWAYPREFNDAGTAGQVSGSPNSFTRIMSISHLTFLTQGYAIMDAATMPVIGDPETMNNTFIEQIVDSAKAAIDKAVEMGVADPERVGVGGHSYGAFMTANLLAHCDLFKAGIARSGAYNRTLTPFGFQSERRSFWDAKNIYFSISPFMHANKIKEPMLLIHGEEDNNSGTFPMQSKRMYQAIKGNGGTVRLVMLPEESHGYRARESVLHTQAEMIEWFDKYVKNAKVESRP